MLQKNRRGLLIVFEGVDRSGKSTQVNLLEKYFIDKRNEKVDKIRFPGKNNF